MAKPNMTLRALVEQCQVDLATLEVELSLKEQGEYFRLREQGIIQSTKVQLQDVSDNLGELKRRLDEFISTLWRDDGT